MKTYEYKTIEAYSHYDLPGGSNPRMPDGEGWRVIKILDHSSFRSGFIVVFERRKPNET